MHIVITGGAGFIGANLAAALLSDGYRVTLYDNLSRPGSSHNLVWLQRRFGDKVVLRRGDIRDAKSTAEALADADTIIHLAGQVAVTTSVANPREDFDINALGTFNVLEGARASGRNPIVLYSSTNKVYGGMEDIVVVEDATRWRYRDLPRGVTEAQPLDFHSPYGCSKGTGDQYVRDYHRIYDLRTVVFRQSAIYGPRQFGVEEICRWFGVPPVMVGHANVTAWGTGIEQIIDGFFKVTVRPALVNIEQAMKKRVLTSAQRVRYTVEWNFDGLLRSNIKDRFEVYAKAVQNGLKTRNECRQLENDPPIAGGDELTAQSNLLPLDKLGTVKPGASNAGTQNPVAQ